MTDTFDTQLLEDAANIIEGKAETHGAPEDSFQRIAHYWNAYFINTGIPDPNITPDDVAELLVLFKLARANGGEYNDDDYRDMISYANFASNLQHD